MKLTKVNEWQCVTNSGREKLMNDLPVERARGLRRQDLADEIQGSGGSVIQNKHIY